MMSELQSAPCGSWKSPITSDLIVEATIGLDDIILDGSVIYWVESRPREGGRNVVVKLQTDGTAEDAVPAAINARNRVHEYGGAAATVSDGVVYTSNYSDQRLYEISPGGTPRPLTPDVGVARDALRYADGRIDKSRQRWIGVRQDHRHSAQEPVNSIVAVDLESGGEGCVLTEGYDFYSNPRLNLDGSKLAWLCWNHPHMPWVESELWTADIGLDGKLANTKKVAGGNGESVFQPEWSPGGQLFFVSDIGGWWNLYCQEDTRVRAVCPMQAEFGLAQWVFGQSTYAFLSENEIICSFTQATGKLARLNSRSGVLIEFDLPFTEYDTIHTAGGKVVMRVSSPLSPQAFVLFDPVSGTVQDLRTSMTENPALKPFMSPAIPVEFPTAGNRKAHAFYYAPRNPEFAIPEGEHPPLVVKCHGGPTHAASSGLDLSVQFWTSRGIAVIDVNYGGSTGFGREYRNLLQGKWGIVDVEDCAAAVAYLVDKKLADPARVVITGGSAGGFTVLACLTASDEKLRQRFASGASHYGVSDAAALARDTHKFESRYLDWLIGPYSDPDPLVQKRYRQLYIDRSPVHASARINVPVAFFQGDEDVIVPPGQTEIMVEALRRKGIPVCYLLFAGEQHGFRDAQNIRRALDAELSFFAVEAFKTGLRF